MQISKLFSGFISTAVLDGGNFGNIVGVSGRLDADPPSFVSGSSTLVSVTPSISFFSRHLYRHSDIKAVTCSNRSGPNFFVTAAMVFCTPFVFAASISLTALLTIVS